MFKSTCEHGTDLISYKITNMRILMSRAMRKCVLCHMRTTKVQISLRIHTV